MAASLARKVGLSTDQGRLSEQIPLVDRLVDLSTLDLIYGDYEWKIYSLQEGLKLLGKGLPRCHGKAKLTQAGRINLGGFRLP
ncbi:MAG: hypothetical protein KGQ93_07725 [Cyanobacteria bacterium REEB459]|nr:hypothetical protein [Cyanobacteria bacterium REEB459]